MLVWELLYDTLFEMGLLNQIGQASGGSTTTVVDSSLTLTADTKVGGTIMIFETTDDLAPLGEFARVTDNDATSYTFAAMTAAVGSGDRYAYIAKDFNLYELLPAVNLALRQVGRIGQIDVSLTTAADQRQYDLPVAVKKGYIRSVAIMQDADDSNDPQYGYRYDWKVIPSAAGNTAILEFAEQPASGMTIRIAYVAAAPAVSAFSATIHESIPQELAKVSLKYALNKSRNEEAIASQDGYRDLYGASRDEFEQAKIEFPIWKPPMIKPARTFGRR